MREIIRKIIRKLKRETMCRIMRKSERRAVCSFMCDIMCRNNEESGYLSEAVKRLLEVMEYDVPYTGSALMKKLELGLREGFRRNYLHPALELNLIRMTIPDKPNSGNQRYVKI